MTDTEWYTELVDEHHGQTMRMGRLVVRDRSEFQALEIFDNPSLGRVLLLDGKVMLTQRDEHIYHEMLVHPGLLAHPDPERVLVIGGGDGGTLREVVKHPQVKRAVLCEIDRMVIDRSREFLPFTAVGFEDPRVEVMVGDGVEFMRRHKAEFDVVIVDSTDPVGMAEGLFGERFYRDVKAALRGRGLMVAQTESPFFGFETWKRIFGELGRAFRKVRGYHAAIPMYPSGHWTFAFASDELEPQTCFDRRRADALSGLRYYTAGLQRGAFLMPAYARGIVDLEPGDV